MAAAISGVWLLAGQKMVRKGGITEGCGSVAGGDRGRSNGHGWSQNKDFDKMKLCGWSDRLEVALLHWENGSNGSGCGGNWLQKYRRQRRLQWRWWC